MRKMGVVAGALLTVVLLGGCAAGTAEVLSAPKVEKPVAEASAQPTAAAITAEPVEPTAELTRAQERGFVDERDWFLRGLAGGLSFEQPSDDALVGAGLLACEQMSAGTPREEVAVVEGGTEQDNQNVAKMAAEVYCPEFF